MTRFETGRRRRGLFRNNRGRRSADLLIELFENDAAVESQCLRICTQPGPCIETTVRWTLLALECRKAIEPNLGFVSQLFERKTATLTGCAK